MEAVAGNDVARIVEENVRLVHFFMSKFPLLDADQDEYESDLYLSLYKSAQKFDPARGFAFSTYAMGGFKFVRSKLWKKSKRIPHHHQLDTSAKFEPAKNRRIDQGYVWDEEDVAEVREEVEKLPARDKRVLRSYLGGLTCSEISREMRSSRQWVSKIYNDGIQRMRARMVAND